MKNQESVSKIKSLLKKIVLVTSAILIFSASIGIAEIFSRYILPSSTQVSNNLTSPSGKLYFISLAKSQVESEAKALAGDYQKLGAGGFVWKADEYFHVVASCYEKENDAQLVQNNIKTNLNLDSQVFTVDFCGISLSGEYEAEQKKVLSRALKIFYTTFQELFDIAVSLDTNVYNEISARLAVNGCYQSFNAVLTDFNTLFSAESPEIIASQLKSGVKIMEELCSGKLINKGQTYSSLIKYHYTNLLNCYYQFLQK